MFSFLSSNNSKLRDRTSTQKDYQKAIKLHEMAVASAQTQRQEAIKNQTIGEKPYPISNEEIIENTWFDELSSKMRLLNAHYSMGAGIDTIYPIYESMANAIQHINKFETPLYYPVLQTISISLFISKKDEDVEHLKDIAKKHYPDDYLMNFLLYPEQKQSLNIESLVISKPFAGCAEAVKMSIQSADKAIERLSKYINNQWKNSYVFQKYDSNKKDYYVGNWCFESAAVIKILEIDDFSWKDKEYYPYDLKKW